MRRLTVADVEELLVADDEDAAQRLTQLVDWHLDRAMTLARLYFGAAALLLAALLAALFGSHTHLSTVEGILVGLGIVASGVMGAYGLSQAGKVHEDYVAALRLLRELAPLTPLLRLFRE